jgi:arsenate reductase
MAELGVDISSHRSKSTDEFHDVEFDLVVTVCDNAAKNCPAWLGQERVIHIAFPDPAAAEGSESEQLQVFRQVRDAIRQEILDHLAQIQAQEGRDKNSGLEVYLA